TATVGLFVSIAVILVTDGALGTATFAAWGWRIPFLLSLVLVAISVYIRLRLQETPLFSRLKASGRSSARPLREALASRANWKLILLALFGATAGQAVVWYTGQFLALFYMQRILKVDLFTSNEIMFVALVLATPLFIAVYGATSGNLYLALLWPILVPIMTFVIGMIWLPETKDTKIWEEVTPAPAYGGPASMSRAGADVGPTMK